MGGIAHERRRRDRALPSGTVTFLFTEVEDSTRLWEESRDVMQHAMPCHDELLRDAVESHGGFIVKTTGDGFHAVFSTAARRRHRCGCRTDLAPRRRMEHRRDGARPDGDTHGRSRVSRRRLLRQRGEPRRRD